jgi:hypothetical protein
MAELVANFDRHFAQIVGLSPPFQCSQATILPAIEGLAACAFAAHAGQTPRAL